MATEAGRRFVAPEAIRLMRRGRGKVPPPPFGLKRFDDTASAIAVLVDAPGGEADVRAVCAQLPDPKELAPGTMVAVLAEADGDARLFGRLFGARPTVSRGVRGSALLARGYSHIGGEGDLVWGFAGEASAL